MLTPDVINSFRLVIVLWDNRKFVCEGPSQGWWSIEPWSVFVRLGWFDLFQSIGEISTGRQAEDFIIGKSKCRLCRR
jgi:hypothetical protein